MLITYWIRDDLRSRPLSAVRQFNRYWYQSMLDDQNDEIPTGSLERSTFRLLRRNCGHELEVVWLTECSKGRVRTGPRLSTHSNRKTLAPTPWSDGFQSLRARL